MRGLLLAGEEGANNFCLRVSTGPTAVSGSRISLRAPRRGGGGDPLCVLASRKRGPTYIASYTHTLGSWDGFFMKSHSR